MRTVLRKPLTEKLFRWMTHTPQKSKSRWMDDFTNSKISKTVQINRSKRINCTIFSTFYIRYSKTLNRRNQKVLKKEYLDELNDISGCYP